MDNTQMSELRDEAAIVEIFEWIRKWIWRHPLRTAVITIGAIYFGWPDLCGAALKLWDALGESYSTKLLAGLAFAFALRGIVTELLVLLDQKVVYAITCATVSALLLVGIYYLVPLAWFASGKAPIFLILGAGLAFCMAVGVYLLAGEALFGHLHKDVVAKDRPSDALPPPKIASKPVLYKDDGYTFIPSPKSYIFPGNAILY